MNSDYIQKIVNAVAHPVIVVNQNNLIVAANAEALEFLGINGNLKTPTTFGTAIKCFNAINYGTCGSSAFCDQCQLSSAIDYIIDHHDESIVKKCVICLNTNNIERYISIDFTANYFGEENNDYVVITLNKIEPYVFPAHENIVISDAPFSSINLIEKYEKNDILNGFIDSFLNYFSHGLIIFDSNGNPLKINHKLLEMTGISFDNLLIKLQSGLLLTLGNNSNNKLDYWSFISKIPLKTGSIKGFISNHRNEPIPVCFDRLPLEFPIDNSIITLLIITDNPIYDDTTNCDAHYHAIENAPMECFFVNASGEIVYANNNAREGFGWFSPFDIPLKIFNICLGKDLMWWLNIQKQIMDKKTVRLQSIHINNTGETYPVDILIYIIYINNKQLYCYSATPIQHHTEQLDSINDLKINNSLSEISRELSFFDNFSSVALLVRQYAMEITNSNFCFLTYFDPESLQFVTSVYADSPSSFSNEVQYVSDYLIQFYKTIYSDTNPNRNSSQRIVNQDEMFSIHNTPLSQVLPFNNMAWVGVFFHNEFQGLLFVGGSENAYTTKDLGNLENLSNLFGLAINRIHEKSRLIESNSRVSLAMKVARMGMFEILVAEHIVRFSPQLNLLLGGNNAELSISIDDALFLVHPDDRNTLLNEINYLDEGSGESKSIQIRMAYPGLEMRWYLINTVVLRRTPQGVPIHIVGVQLDVNDQILANENLKNSREEAIAANNAKSAFLARVSHELRTPLNAIIGFADLLATNITSPSQLEFLKGIHNSGHTLMELINDVLDFSKIEAGKLSIMPSSTHLHQLITDIKQLFIGIIHEKNLDFIIESDNNIPEFVIIDELRVKQILINLIGNAVKFTNSGYIKLSVNSTIDNNAANLTFTIQDTGIGIQANSQQLIFNDFTQIDDPDNRRFGGTGLGLGIVKRLIELMGGDIKLFSEPGKGSSFVVHIPNCPISGDLEVDVENETWAKDDKTIDYSPIDRITPSVADIKLFQSKMAIEWSELIRMPSLKLIPPICDKFNELSSLFETPYFSNVNDQLIRCKNTYNISEFNNIIKEVNHFTQTL